MTMTELKDVLDRAVPATAAADPERDLARGRARLRRTRRTRLALLGGAAAVAVAVPLGVGLGSPGSAGRPVPASAGASTALPATDLVAYTGDQVPGYEVSEVPQGWEIQGGNAFGLVLAPKGFPDRNADNYEHKIAVMLSSKDEGGLGDEGNPVTVAGRPGIWVTSGDTQLLRFVGADGRIVNVQVPTNLHWDGARLARFGAGITVLANADQGVG